MATDEVLFRSKGAPDRYAEDDFYWADTDLPSEVKLPDPDLLKAIHTYASDFYSRAFGDKGKVDVLSMDETALLAFGILLEEAALQILGETGDLALVGGYTSALSSDIASAGSIVASSVSDSNASISEDQHRNAIKRRKLYFSTSGEEQLGVSSPDEGQSQGGEGTMDSNVLVDVKGKAKETFDSWM